jgi:hypothetical protein
MLKGTDKEKMKEFVQDGVTRFQEIALEIGYPPLLRNEKRKDYEEIDPKIKCAKEQIKDLFLNSSPFINPSVVILGMVMGAGCKFLYKKIKERRQRKKAQFC